MAIHEGNILHKQNHITFPVTYAYFITILWLVSILACISKGSSLPVPPFLVQNSYGPPNKIMIRNHCYHQRIICSPQLIVPPPSRWLNSSTISTPVSVSVSYSSLLTIKLYFTTVAIFSCKRLRYCLLSNIKQIRQICFIYFAHQISIIMLFFSTDNTLPMSQYPQGKASVSTFLQLVMMYHRRR